MQCPAACLVFVSAHKFLDIFFIIYKIIEKKFRVFLYILLLSCLWLRLYDKRRFCYLFVLEISVGTMAPDVYETRASVSSSCTAHAVDLTYMHTHAYASACTQGWDRVHGERCALNMETAIALVEVQTRWRTIVTAFAVKQFRRPVS